MVQASAIYYIQADRVCVKNSQVFVTVATRVSLGHLSAIQLKNSFGENVLHLSLTVPEL